jgi:transcriptional regulator with XRE-family HTH domain
VSDRFDAKKLVGERLKTAREKAGLTQAQVAQRLRVTEMTVYRWESGKYEPSYGKLQLLSDLYQQPVESFIGDRPSTIVEPSSPGFLRIPVRGYVSAGASRETWDIDLGTVPIPDQQIEQYSDLFALAVSGDDLQGDGIHSGDLVYVDPHASLEAGKIYVVRMEDGQICARHLNFEDGQVRLRSSYDHYDELRVTGTQLLGKIVWHLRKMH